MMTDQTGSNAEKSDTKEDSYKRRTFIDSRATLTEKLQWKIESFAWDHFYWNRYDKMDVETAVLKSASLFRWLGPNVGKSANRTARRNLKMAFPEWTDSQISDCLLKSWENFGHIAAEFPHLKDFRDTGDNPRLTIKGEEHARAIKATGKPCVIISCHRANISTRKSP